MTGGRPYAYWESKLGATERQLLSELRSRSGRLGTHFERPDDQSEVERIAHTLNNALTVIFVRETIGLICPDTHPVLSSQGHGL